MFITLGRIVNICSTYFDHPFICIIIPWITRKTKGKFYLLRVIRRVMQFERGAYFYTWVGGVGMEGFIKIFDISFSTIKREFDWAERGIFSLSLLKISNGNFLSWIIIFRSILDKRCVLLFPF